MLSPARAQGSESDSSLSPRERELLALVGRGLTDKQIAADLMISLTTVRSHLERIRDKTGQRRRDVRPPPVRTGSDRPSRLAP
jgi:DNA-binding CsgD family transcriptional regulator